MKIILRQEKHGKGKDKYQRLCLHKDLPLCHRIFCLSEVKQMLGLRRTTAGLPGSLDLGF